jgi:hypothetical protein
MAAWSPRGHEEKVWDRLFETVVTGMASGARVVLQQQAAVVAMQLPQGVPGVCRAAGGMRVGWRAAWLAAGHQDN